MKGLDRVISEVTPGSDTLKGCVVSQGVCWLLFDFLQPYSPHSSKLKGSETKSQQHGKVQDVFEIF